MSASRATPSSTRPPVTERARAALRVGGVDGLITMVGHAVGWRWRRLTRTLLARMPDPVRRRLSRSASLSAPAEPDAAELRLQGVTTPPRTAVSEPAFLRVGIVIPVTGTADDLDAAIRSVQRQTFRDWQCVIVDDASPDDVASVVKPFRLTDRRVTLLRHAAPGGGAAASNTGLRAVDADVVVFLLPSRLLHPTALTRVVDEWSPVWADASVAGVYGPIVEVPASTDQSVIDQMTDNSRSHWLDWTTWAGRDPFAQHGAFLRTALVDRCGGFDESLDDHAASGQLALRLLRHGYRFAPTRSLVGVTRLSDEAGDEAAMRAHSTATLAAAAEQWARLDAELVVDRAAAAPLSLATSALERAVRTATLIGGRVAAAATLDALDETDLLDAVGPGLVQARRSDVVGAAIDGLLSELRREGAPSDALVTASRRKVAIVADRIADAVYSRSAAAACPGDLDVPARNPRVDVLVLTESAADVHALLPLVQALAVDTRVFAVDLTVVAGESGARAAWHAAGVDTMTYHQATRSITNVSLVVACAPVGPIVADLVCTARAAGATCRLVRSPGRPATLDVNVAAPFESMVVPMSEASSAVEGRGGGRLLPDSLAGWRGTKFPALLPFEDGPADVPSRAKLERLRDSRRGETAVVIGNGPSLNDTDLELLSDVATFGVNGIFLAVHRLPRPITYYVVEDTSVFKENLTAIKAFEADWKLFPAMYRSSFADDEVTDRTVFFRMNAGFYDRKTGTTGHPRFSTDVTQRVYCGQSVTIINLQLAHWMGFQRVVLIGMDFNYTIPDDVDRDGALIISRSDDPNHFDPRYFGAGKSWKDPLLDRVLVSYHLVDEMYRATGREIINATVGGKLDVFPRLPLRTALDRR